MLEGLFQNQASFKVLAIAVVVLLGLIIYTATAGGSLLASLLGFVTSPHAEREHPGHRGRLRSLWI